LSLKKCLEIELGIVETHFNNAFACRVHVARTRDGALL
jgi:hypothetical protein